MTAAAIASALLVPPDLLAAAGWRDAADGQVREALGYGGHRGADLGGLLIPYFHPRTGAVLGHRVRLVHPVTGERGEAKYLSTPAMRWLYFGPTPAEWLDDASVPVVLVEAEKSALAGVALDARHGIKRVWIATGGISGWRRTVTKEPQPDGTLAGITGPSPSLDLLTWDHREAILFRDANVAGRQDLMCASGALAHGLIGRGATVKFADAPKLEGVNGPDDLMAVAGDDAPLKALEAARAFPEAAQLEAEAAVSALEAMDAAARKTAPMPTAELADVGDAELRARLVGRVAALRIAGVTRAAIESPVARRQAEAEAARRQAAEAARRGKLLGMDVRPAELLAGLERYFSARAYLPDGGAITLALWTTLTHCIDAFATAPYLCLESAAPDCGKSTVLDLLEAVCARAEQCSGLTRAVLVRTIEKNHATVLLDQGEWLRDKKDETGIMGVLLSGYRRGKPYRCVEGEGHDLASFDTFGPKAFCAVGGLSGPLLSRCHVLHMERLAAGVELESAEPEDLAPVAGPLRERLEAFALQAAPALAQIVGARPKGGYWPQFSNRERQLWTPLLTIARGCGSETEARAVQAAELLAGRKAQARADDPRVAKIIALAEVLERVEAEKFSPGDLVPALAETEAWGEALAEKLRKDDTGKAAANLVGYILREFRLASRERPHGKTLYSSAEALAAAKRHTPPSPKPSAASAACAAEPHKQRAKNAADGLALSAADQSASAAAGMDGVRLPSAAADAYAAAADRPNQSATKNARVNGGVAADAADAADKTGPGGGVTQPDLFAPPPAPPTQPKAEGQTWGESIARARREGRLPAAEPPVRPAGEVEL